MRQKALLRWAATFFLGSIWHFFYDWLPVLPVAMVAPINESVWEHLKLLYFPVLLVQGISLYYEDSNRRLGGICFALLKMPIILLGSFYLLKCGFGVEQLWVDILLYGLTLGVGEWLMQHTAEGLYRHRGGLFTLAVIYGILMVLLSFAVPDFPVFEVAM